MPRKGSAYPITAQWRADVVARIAELGISQNELARRARVSKASLSEALSDTSKQSTCVPAIHRALGWPPPSPLRMANDAAEMMSIFEGLSPHNRGVVLERARIVAEEQRKKNRS